MKELALTTLALGRTNLPADVLKRSQVAATQSQSRRLLRPVVAYGNIITQLTHQTHNTSQGRFRVFKLLK
jgi:hypothetical protein